MLLALWSRADLIRTSGSLTFEVWLDAFFPEISCYLFWGLSCSEHLAGISLKRANSRPAYWTLCEMESRHVFQFLFFCNLNDSHWRLWRLSLEDDPLTLTILFRQATWRELLRLAILLMTRESYQAACVLARLLTRGHASRFMTDDIVAELGVFTI